MLPEGWVDAAAPPPTLIAGFLDKLRAKVIENLQIQVRSLHVRWVDRQSNPAAPFAVGLTMELLRVETTNGDWDPLNADKAGGGGAGGRGSGGGASGGPQRHVLKRLKVKNLAVYCQALPVDESLPVHVDVAEEAGGGAEAERVVSSLFDQDVSVCDAKNFARLFQDCIPTRDQLLRQQSQPPPQQPGGSPSPPGVVSATLPPPLPSFETLRPGHPFERDLVLLPVDPEVRLQLSKHAASLSRPQRTIDVIIDGVALHVQVRQYEAGLSLAAGFACYDARLRHAHLRPAQALRKLPHRPHDGAAPRTASDEKVAHSRIVRSWWRYAAVATLRDHAASRPGFRTRWSDLCDYRVLRKAYISLHQRSVAASEPPTAWRSERLRAFHRFQSRHHFADAETDWLHSARRQAVKQASRKQPAPGVPAFSAPPRPPGVSSSGPDSTSSSQGTSSDDSSLASPRVARAPPELDAVTREARATANLLSWSDAALIRPLLHRSLLAFPLLGWARRYKAAWMRAVDAASSESEGSEADVSGEAGRRGAASSFGEHGPWEELESLMAERPTLTPGGPRAGLNAQETVLLHYLETVLPLPDIILLRLVAQRQLRLEAASEDHQRRVGLPTGGAAAGPVPLPPTRPQSARRRSNFRNAGLAHGPAHLEWHEEGDEEDTSQSDGSSRSSPSSSSGGEDAARRRGLAQAARHSATGASFDVSPHAAHARAVAFASTAALRLPRPVDSDCYDASDDELAEAGRGAAVGGKASSALQRGSLFHAHALPIAAMVARPPSTDTPSRVSVTGAVRRHLSASAASAAPHHGADGDARASLTAHPHPLKPHHSRARGVGARAPGSAPAVAATAAATEASLAAGSRVTVSTTSSPPRGDDRPFPVAGHVVPSVSGDSLGSDQSSFKNPSDESGDVRGAAPVDRKPLSAWFDFSWLWSDRGVSVAGPASAVPGAPALSSSAFAAATAVSTKSRTAGAAASRAHLERMRTATDPPPPEERERRMLEAQRREFFEVRFWAVLSLRRSRPRASYILQLIDYDPCEALEPYPKSYVHTHVSLQLSCFTIVLAHGGANASVLPLLYCQLRGLGVELSQRPSSFRYAVSLSDLEVADATASSCEEFSRLLRKSPAAVSSVRRSESSSSFATHDGARTVTAAQPDSGGAQQAQAPLLRIIYETFPSDSNAASAIAGGLGASLQEAEAPVPGPFPVDSVLSTFGDRESVSGFYPAPPLGPLRAPLAGAFDSSERPDGSEVARAQMSGAKSRRSLQRRHARARGRDKPGGSSHVSSATGPGEALSFVPSSVTLLDQSSQLGSVRSKHSQGSARRSRTASSVTRSVHVRLRRPAWTVNADHALVVHLQPLEAVLNAPLLARVAGLLFKPAATLESVPGGRLVLSSFESELASVSRGLEAAYAQRIALAVDIRVAHPVLVIPENVREANSRLVVIDLGRLTVASRELRSKGDIAAAAKRLQTCTTVSSVIPASPEVSTDAEPIVRPPASASLLSSPTRGVSTSARAALPDEGVANRLPGALDEVAHYDTFELRLAKAQVYLARGGSNWRCSGDQWPASKGLALLHDNFCLTAVINSSVMPDDPALPRMKVSVAVPALHVRVSSAQWDVLQQFVALLPPVPRTVAPTLHSSRLNSRGIMSALNRDLPTFSGSKLEQWLTSITRVGPMLRMTSDSEAGVSAHGYTTANSTVHRSFNDSAVGYSTATSGPARRGVPLANGAGHRRDSLPAATPVADKRALATATKFKAARSQRLIRHRREHDAGRDFAAAAIAEMRHAVYGTPEDSPAFGFALTLSSVSLEVLECSTETLENRWRSDLGERIDAERTIVVLRASELSLLHTSRAQNVEVVFSVENAGVEDCTSASASRRMLLSGAGSRGGYRRGLDDDTFVPPIAPLLAARFSRKLVLHVSDGVVPARGGTADPRQLLPHTDSSVDVACGGLVVNVNEPTIALLLRLFLPHASTGGLGGVASTVAPLACQGDPALVDLTGCSQVGSGSGAPESLSISLPPEPVPVTNSYWHTEEVARVRFQLASLEVRLFDVASQPLVIATLGESRVSLRSASLLQQQLGSRLEDIALAGAGRGAIPATPLLCRTPLPYSGTPMMRAGSSSTAAAPPTFFLDESAQMPPQVPARQHRPGPSTTSQHPLPVAPSRSGALPIHCALILPRVNADRSDVDNWQCLSVLSSSPVGSSKASLRVGALRLRTHGHAVVAHDESAAGTDVVSMFVPGEQLLVSCEYLDAPLTKFAVVPDFVATGSAEDHDDDDVSRELPMMFVSESFADRPRDVSLSAHFPAGLAISPSLAVGRMDELSERDVRSLADRATMLRVHVRGVAVAIDSTFFARLAAAARSSALLSRIASPAEQLTIAAGTGILSPVRWQSTDVVKRYDVRMDSSAVSLSLGAPTAASLPMRAELLLSLQALSLRNSFIDPSARGRSGPSREAVSRCAPQGSWSEAICAKAVGVALELRAAHGQAVITPIIQSTDISCDLEAPAVFVHSASHSAPAWSVAGSDDELLPLVASRVVLSPVAVRVTPQILAAAVAALHTVGALSVVDWGPAFAPPARAPSVVAALSRLLMTAELSRVSVSLADDAGAGAIADVELIGVVASVKMRNYAPTATRSLLSLSATHLEQCSLSIAEIYVKNLLATREFADGAVIFARQAQTPPSSSPLPFVSCVYRVDDEVASNPRRTIDLSCENPCLLVIPDFVAALLAFLMRPELQYSAEDHPSAAIPNSSRISGSIHVLGAIDSNSDIRLRADIVRPEIWVFPSSSLSASTALVLNVGNSVTCTMSAPTGSDPLLISACDLSACLCAPSKGLSSRQRDNLVSLSMLEATLHQDRPISVDIGPAHVHASLTELVSASQLYTHFISVAFSGLPASTASGLLDSGIHASAVEVTLVDRSASLVAVPLVHVVVTGLAVYTRVSGDFRVLIDGPESGLRARIRDSISNSWVPLIHRCNFFEAAHSGFPTGLCFTLTSLRPGASRESVDLFLSDVAAETLHRLTAGLSSPESAPEKQSPPLFRLRNDSGVRLAFRLNRTSGVASDAPWESLSQGHEVGVSSRTALSVVLDDDARAPGIDSGLWVDLSVRRFGEGSTPPPVPQPGECGDVEWEVAESRVQLARCGVTELSVPLSGRGGVLVAETVSDGRGCLVTRLRSTFLLSNLLDVPVRFELVYDAGIAWSALVLPGHCAWVPAHLADASGLRVCFSIDRGTRTLRGEVDGGFYSGSLWGGLPLSQHARIPLSSSDMEQPQQRRPPPGCVIAEMSVGSDARAAAAVGGDSSTRAAFGVTAAIGDAGFKGGGSPPTESEDPCTAWLGSASSALPLAECDPATFSGTGATLGDGTFPAGALRVLSLHLPLMLTNLLPVSTELRSRDVVAASDVYHIPLGSSPPVGALKRSALMSGEVFGSLSHACVLEFRPANMHGWSSTTTVGLTLQPAVDLASALDSSVAARTPGPANAAVSTVALRCIDAAGLSTVVHLETSVTRSGCRRCILYAPYTFQDRSGLGLQLSWGTPYVRVRSAFIEGVAAASSALGANVLAADAAGGLAAAVEKPVSSLRRFATTIGNVMLSPLFSSRSGDSGVGAAATAGSRSDRCGGSSLRRDLDAAASALDGEAAPSPFHVDRSGLLAEGESRIDGAFYTPCAPTLLLPAFDPSSERALADVVDRGEWTLGLSCARGSFAERFTPVEVRALLGGAAQRQRDDEGHAVVSTSLSLMTGIADGEVCVVSATASAALSAQVLGSSGRSWGGTRDTRTRFHDSVAFRPVAASPWSWMLTRTIVLRAVPRLVLHNATPFPLMMAPRVLDGRLATVAPGARAVVSTNHVALDLGRAAVRIGFGSGKSNADASWSAPIVVDAAPGDGFVDSPFRAVAAACDSSGGSGLVQATWLWLASSAQPRGVSSGVDRVSDLRDVPAPDEPSMLLLLRSSADELCAFEPLSQGRTSRGPPFSAILRTDFGCATTILTACVCDDRLPKESDPVDDAAVHSSTASPRPRNLPRGEADPSASVLVDASKTVPPFKVSNRTRHPIFVTQEDLRDSAASQPSPRGLQLNPHSTADFCWPDPASAPAAQRRLRFWVAQEDTRVYLGELDPDAVGLGVISAELGDECVCVDVRRVAASLAATGERAMLAGLQQELSIFARPRSSGHLDDTRSKTVALASQIPTPSLVRFSVKFSLRVTLGLRARTWGSCRTGRISPIAFLDLSNVDARHWLVRRGSVGDPWGISLRLGTMRLVDARPGAPVPLALGPLLGQCEAGSSKEAALSVPHLDFELNSVASPHNPLLRQSAGSAADDALSLDVALAIAPTALGIDEHFFVELTHAVNALLSAAIPDTSSAHVVTGSDEEEPLLVTPNRAAVDVSLQSPSPLRRFTGDTHCLGTATSTPHLVASFCSPLSTPRQRWAAVRAGAALQRGGMNCHHSGQLGRSRTGTPRAPLLSVRSASVVLAPIAPPGAPFSAHVASLRLSPLSLAVSVVDETTQRASRSSSALAARCGPVPLAGMLPMWARETVAWLRWTSVRCGTPLPICLDSIALPVTGFVSHDPIFLSDAFAALFIQHVANPAALVRANAALLWAALSRVFGSGSTGSRDDGQTGPVVAQRTWSLAVVQLE